jgi:hypothetical protein
METQSEEFKHKTTNDDYKHWLSVKKTESEDDTKEKPFLLILC